MPIISDKLKKQEKRAAAEDKKRKEEEEHRLREEQAKKEQEEREQKEKEDQEKRQKKDEKKQKRKERKTQEKKAKEDLERKANMRKEMALIRKTMQAKQTRDEAGIERQGVQIMRQEIKSGHFSKIYKAKQGDQENLICKVVVLEKTPIPYRENLLKQSLQIQRYIGGGATDVNTTGGTSDAKHPNLCKVIDIFATDKKAYIFMEECDPKSIEHKIKQSETVDEAEVKNLMRQICESVRYLHSVGVAHFHVKASHVITDKEGKVKLVGLNNCSFYWDSDMEQVVPRKKLHKKEWSKNDFLPPEAFEADFDGSKADVWGVGILMVALIARENPFKIKSESPFDEQWKNFAQTKQFSDEAKQLLDRIFVVDPQNRPSMAEVLEDPYLAVNAS